MDSIKSVLGNVWNIKTQEKVDENNIVDVYTWPQGMYFVRIMDENDAVSTVKFVKQ